MTAYLIKDEYSDITLNYPYEVDRVYSDGHIRLKNSPRIYDGKSFRILHKGNSVSLSKAYEIYRVDVLMKKIGMK